MKEDSGDPQDRKETNDETNDVVVIEDMRERTLGRIVFVVLMILTLSAMAVALGENRTIGTFTGTVDFLRATVAVFMVLSSITLYLHATYWRRVHYPWPFYLYLSVIGFGFLLVTVAPAATSVPDSRDEMAILGMVLVACANASVVTAFMLMADSRLSRLPYVTVSFKGLNESRQRKQMHETEGESYTSMTHSEREGTQAVIQDSADERREEE